MNKMKNDITSFGCVLFTYQNLIVCLPAFTSIYTQWQLTHLDKYLLDIKMSPNTHTHTLKILLETNFHLFYVSKSRMYMTIGICNVLCI